MTAEESDGLSLRSYLRVVFRWKWLILAVTLVVVAAWDGPYTWTRTPLYSASTQLLYVQQVDIQNPLSQYVDAQRAAGRDRGRAGDHRHLGAADVRPRG